MEEKAYKYMVSVRCFTFNQSKYILDALNGFVMQETNFPYVVMVVDDASTDGEQEVIRKFVTEQFDIADNSVAYKKETDYAHITYAQHKTNKNCFIAVLYLKENLYSQGRSEEKFKYLSEWRDYVKYEAVCEGDDYWIDAQKLQKQVDFLEEHEEYNLCTHRIYRFDQENNIFYKDVFDYKFKNNQGIDITNRTKVWLAETSSVLYRRSAHEEYLKYDGMKRDIISIYFVLKSGRGYCFSKPMSVYRQNLGGVFAKQSVDVKLINGSYKAIKELYNKEKTRDSRFLYYRYYANTFILTKGRILFLEKFNLRKILSLVIFIPSVVFMKHPSYKPITNSVFISNLKNIK